LFGIELFLAVNLWTGFLGKAPAEHEPGRGLRPDNVVGVFAGMIFA
jgi:hypothetical protein